MILVSCMLDCHDIADVIQLMKTARRKVSGIWPSHISGGGLKPRRGWGSVASKQSVGRASEALIGTMDGVIV